MGHFRGTIKGNKGVVSRFGNKKSGLTAHINGRDIGVDVELSHENGRDIVRVWLTGGSNATGGRVILTVTDRFPGLKATEETGQILKVEMAKAILTGPEVRSLGGMTKPEAREILREAGWSTEQIEKWEGR